ncbi:MAG: hypothetical protein DWQ34_13700 [Planctomycetota bacterium]|nr:MAG: hypothetical protein DWQ34_13700 [Planctomycetota bacterium]REJ95504.1 MAG: hypothetical protein DWQ29_01920 [Planctomycetota bacterium]REK27249.1 MAG: hypothetical protein DWQ41_07715 [Planctomycetota bacterium]REK36729.1 MAG: hypothetical protein DWQ45_08920 [Planctomycetota bacterium]
MSTSSKFRRCGRERRSTNAAGIGLIVVIPVAGLFAALPSLCVLSGGLIFRTIQKQTIEH